MSAPAHPWLVPEVLQTSPLDCGPAALAALLAGFGVEQPFERLRDACRTGRDGTSIDAIESAAVEQGLDAEQILVPADHLALPEAACLPCILVVRQAAGATHFVVLWRRHGRHVQLMDPAAGRRWPTLAALEREVYRHRAVVPAAAWRAWAATGGLLDPLAARLAALGIPAAERRALLDGLRPGTTTGIPRSAADRRAAARSAAVEAAAAGGWRAPAALDAAARFTRQLVAAGGVRTGRDAARILSGLLARLDLAGRPDGVDRPDGLDYPDGLDRRGPRPAGHAAGDAPALAPATLPERAAVVPESCWSVHPAAPGPAGEERVAVEGAVLLRVRGRLRRAEPAAAARANRRRPSRPPAAVAPANRRLPSVALAWTAPAPATLPRLPSEAPAWIVLALAALGAAAGRLAEVALFAACLELLPALPSRSMRLAVLASLLVLAAAQLLFELAGTRTALALGRGSETFLRLRLAAKLPRLPDGYLRTRSVADLAERAHLLARVRRGPEIAAAVLRAGIDAALAAAGIAWLDPPLAAAALAAGAAAVLVPCLLLRPLDERSRRASAHAAALGGFYLDVLRGLAAVHAHQAAAACRRRHDELLAGWLRARRAATAAAGRLEISTQALLGAAAAGLVLAHVERRGLDARTLVLVLWASQLLGAGQRLALLAGRELPLHRTLMRRIEEPLAAREEPARLETAAAAGHVASAEPAGAAADVPDVPAALETALAAAGRGRIAPTDPLGRAAGPAARHRAWSAGEPLAPASPRERPAGVALSLVRLSVETAGRTLLRDLDLRIHAGQHVAILGRSGAGKSTLLGTLLGWNLPAAGVLLADGRPLDGDALAELHRATAWVAPEVTLWSTSVLDNLCYGPDAEDSSPGAAGPDAEGTLATTAAIPDTATTRPAAAGPDAADLPSAAAGPDAADTLPAAASLPPVEALRAAQLLDLLPRLPHGLGTLLGEAGGRLSGGEGQRLRFARALVRPGIRLALLDEAFRGLDAVQRRGLLAAARARWRRATLLCVTHSPAEAAGFDRLLILDGGRIAEDGAPGPLAARPDSRFRALLDAEARAAAAFKAPGWRRLRLSGGRLREHEPGPALPASRPAPLPAEPCR